MSVCVCVVCSFVTSAWGPCSATCGVSVRSRRVQCKAFVKETSSVQDLPDSACTGHWLTRHRCHHHSLPDSLRKPVPEAQVVRSSVFLQQQVMDSLPRSLAVTILGWSAIEPGFKSRSSQSKYVSKYISQASVQTQLRR